MKIERGVLASEIAAAGETAITEIVNSEREETLHLEFKTLSSGSTLNRDDRKMLSKAICGFANAEGGVLIVGIETRKTDGVDTAYQKRPVRNLNRIRRLITAALPEILSPQHSKIELTAIPDSSGDDQGFLLFDVSPSQDRPHMSVAERRYFRRGSDGTRVLDHSEIRELMFAVREGSLDIETNLRSGVSSGAQQFQLWLVLTLRNIGKVPIVAPYIRLKQRGWRPGAGLENVSSRVSADGTFGVYSTRDVLIHLDDEIGMVEYETGLTFESTGQRHLPAAVAAAREPGMEHTYSMLTWDQMHDPNWRTIPNAPISVEGLYGAENAGIKRFEFKIEKPQLLDLFCSVKGLQ